MKENNTSCKVFYDGSCPLCKREIQLYSKLDKEKEIEWFDVSKPESSIPVDVPRDQLLSRIHLLDSEGSLQVGAAAFFYIWKKIPGWRWLGNLKKNKFVFIMAEVFYEVFLLLRPFLQLPFKIYDRFFGKT